MWHWNEYYMERTPQSQSLRKFWNLLHLLLVLPPLALTFVARYAYRKERKRRCINSLKQLFDGSSGIPFRGPLPVLTIPDEPKQVEPEYPFLLIFLTLLPLSLLYIPSLITQLSEVKSNPRQFFTYNPRRSSVSSKTLHADQASPCIPLFFSFCSSFYIFSFLLYTYPLFHRCSSLISA